jgi:hypothetical protein
MKSVRDNFLTNGEVGDATRLVLAEIELKIYYKILYLLPYYVCKYDLHWKEYL